MVQVQQAVLSISSPNVVVDEPLSFETKVGVTSGNNFKSDAMAYEASQT